MSFSWSSLLATAKSALAVAHTLAPIVESAATGVGKLVPGAGPIIAGVEAGAASISAIAPNAVNEVQAAIAAGENLVAIGGPEIKKLEEIWGSLFHATPVPQGILLTAKTTTATAPAAPPVKA